MKTHENHAGFLKSFVAARVPQPMKQSS